MKPEPDGHGTLNWMLVWQSLDGRVCIEYKVDEKEASRHASRLRQFGRTPQVWRLMNVELEVRDA